MKSVFLKLPFSMLFITNKASWRTKLLALNRHSKIVGRISDMKSSGMVLILSSYTSLTKIDAFFCTIDLRLTRDVYMNFINVDKNIVTFDE